MYTEEIIYCSHCGAANKKSAKICAECNKEILSHYRPVYDFLKNHMKDELKGKITDSVYSLIKNYLLSHAYGVVLAVSIVLTGSVVAAGAVQTPHVKQVSEPPTPHAAAVSATAATAAPVQTPVPEETPAQTPAPSETPAQQTPTPAPAVTGTFDSGDRQYVEHVISNYEIFVEEKITDPDYDAAYEPGSDYSSVTQLYASTIPGYSYSGVHEMIGSPIAVGVPTTKAAQWDETGGFNHVSESRKFNYSSLKTGSGLTTALGMQLAADGYNTAEIDFVMTVHSGKDAADTLREKYVYSFVFVEHDGKWYIAEDRLIENTVLV